MKPLSFGVAYRHGPLRVEARRASDNVKARFGADTGPKKGCPRRPAIRPSETSPVVDIGVGRNRL